jgi:hypothetical protein
MKSIDEVLALYKQRVAFYGPLHSKMRLIQSIYNGTAEIPLPDMERSEVPSVPNLLATGVDQMAGRIASVVPNVIFAEKNPNRTEKRRVNTASRVVTGWWQQDRLMMKMKQRARHLIAYGMSPTVLLWDPTRNRPTWHVRHPLEAFPSTDIVPGEVRPTDTIFAYRRSVAWLRSMGYGPQVAQVTGKWDMPNDASMLLVEYLDAECTHLILTSYSEGNDISTMWESTGKMRGVTLEYLVRPSYEMPATVPMRITLDGAAGQFDNMIGMYFMQARLMALETIAVEKGIFPDTYIVSRPGEVGRIIDGPHDGRTGLINIISGGDIRTEQPQPGYLTNPTIDRLERNQRVTAGIPAEFGGESSTNIRTGRRGDAVLSAVIDFPVAEAQETFAYSLEEENRIAIELSKTYAGNKTTTIYVGTGNATKAVTFTPNQVFPETEHVVSYPAAGTDVNSLMIGLGQRIGLGIMSKETAAGLDPFIDNPEVEHDRIIAEGLEQALVASIQQQAAGGQIPPLVLAKVMSLVKADRMEIAEALQKVTDDAAEEQRKAEEEAMAQQGAMGGMGGMGGMSPEAAMAGATMGSMMGPEAAAQVGSPIPGAGQGMEDLGSLLGSLRRPAMTISPMQGVERGAV